MFLTTSFVYGQEMVFNNISNTVSLPSKECYNVMQDHKGYIWIGTELGLCRLNGSSLKIFDKKNNLPEGAVYHIAEDKNGMLWLATSKNRILNYKDGLIKEHQLSKTYQKQLSKMEVTYALRLNEQTKQIFINSNRSTFKLDLQNNRLTKLGTTEKKSLILAQMGGNLIPIINYFHQPFAFKQISVSVTANGKRKTITLKNQNSVLSRYRVLTCKILSTNYFSFTNKLVRINADLSYTIYEMPSGVVSLYRDQQNGLWVGTFKNGVRYYEHGNLDQKPVVSLNGYSVTGVCEDSEKNIWCTTLEKGTFISKNKQIISYANITGLSKPVQFLKSLNELVFTSYFNPNAIPSAQHVKVKYYPELLNKHEYNEVLHMTKALAVTSGNGTSLYGKLLNKQNIPIGNILKQYNNLIYDITKTPDSTIYCISYNYITQIKNGVGTAMLVLKSPGKNILAIDNRTLLFGCLDGLYRLDLETKKVDKIKNMSYPITKIYKSTSNQILVATKGWGLFNMVQNKAIQLNKRFHIPTDVFYDIAEDCLKNIWIGSNVGLIKIDNKKKTTIYTTLNGLPANEIYRIAINNNKIFLSTAEGLSSFPLFENLSNYTPPPIFVQTVSVNQKNINNFRQNLKFPYHQNSLSITFDVLSFKNKEINLLYKLNANDSTYTSRGNILNLNNLKPAKYELEVYGINSDGVKSKHPATFYFIIDSPFWQKLWFIGACILLIAMAISLMIKKIAKNIKKKEQEKTRIGKLVAESKLTALQAQMNPHFVFNAINSIQNYILKKQEREAYDYLAKFSKLIRMVLHNSQEKTISLGEELETLKLYIALEQLRFKKSFDVSIIIAEQIDEYLVNVPTLLIQPYVENAIWHGLMNLENERDGTLKINIYKSEQKLLISIEDNGVGRQRSMAYKATDYHQPVALKLNQQRLSTYNEMYGKENFKIEIEDLYTEQQQPIGTRVTIYLPLNM